LALLARSVRIGPKQEWSHYSHQKQSEKFLRRLLLHVDLAEGSPTMW
jgi:hypothetical protein